MTINTNSTSDAQALNLFFDRKSLTLRTLLIGVADSEPKKNGHVWCIDVIPAIRQVVTIDEDRQDVDQPKISNVPIVSMSSQSLGLSVTVPIKKGDEVLLAVTDRAIDNWQLQGGIQNQLNESVSRHHDLTDVVCIPSMLSVNALGNYNNEAIQVGNDSTQLTVDSNEIRMDNGTGSVSLVGGTFTINANTQVNGNVTVTGVISGEVVQASSSLTVAGKEQSNHTHTAGTYRIGSDNVTGKSGAQS